jgi:hypothetical protein
MMNGIFGSRRRLLIGSSLARRITLIFGSRAVRLEGLLCP